MEWKKIGTSDAVRTAVRFPLQLALHLKTEGGMVDAITHDVSSNGLLFSTPWLTGVGSTIEFSLDMPLEVMGRTGNVSIDCVGRVIRHQHSADRNTGQETMMAAIIDQYSLKAQS
jgi:hypothetical protein